MELQQSLGYGGRVREVIGCEDLALNDRKIDFNLIEPTGMDGAVDQRQARVMALQPCDRAAARWAEPLSTIQYTRRLRDRGSHHDLLHQPIKGSDAALRLATTKHAGAMDIESGQVSPCATTLVLMLDLHRPTGLAKPSGMLARARLNAGFLIRRDHELIVVQPSALPASLIKVQDAASFHGKVRVAREDPSSMLPRTNGVLVQPSPNRATADLSDEA